MSRWDYKRTVRVKASKTIPAPAAGGVLAPDPEVHEHSSRAAGTCCNYFSASLEPGDGEIPVERRFPSTGHFSAES